MIRLMASAIGLGLVYASTPVCVIAAGETRHPRPPSPATPTLLPLVMPSVRAAHIPEGTFRMGSTPEEVLVALTECSSETLSQRCPDWSDEQPVREITLSGFWLDATEVSVERYARCVAARRCKAIPYYQGARRFDRPELPVTMVTYDEAERYCRFAGGALPTEAQFERAARGETRRVYPGGQLYNTGLANHGRLALSPTDPSDGFAELSPVTAYALAATPEGVLQLAGNAREWIRDRYLPYYSDTDRTEPRGPDAASGATERVVRGGGYLSPRGRLRGAARDSAVPERRSADLGFRCAYGSSRYATEGP